LVERLRSHIPATCAHMRHVFATCSEYYVRTWKSDVDKRALKTRGALPRAHMLCLWLNTSVHSV